MKEMHFFLKSISTTKITHHTFTLKNVTNYVNKEFLKFVRKFIKQDSKHTFKNVKLTIK